jgi:hypothetical protein
LSYIYPASAAMPLMLVYKRSIKPACSDERASPIATSYNQSTVSNFGSFTCQMLISSSSAGWSMSV